MQKVSAVLKPSEPTRIFHFYKISQWILTEIESMKELQRGCPSIFPRTRQSRFCTPRVGYRGLRSHKEEKRTRYYKVVSSLLSSYAMADVIFEAEAEITNFYDLEHMSAVTNLDVLWEYHYVVVVSMNKHFLRGLLLNNCTS